MGYFVPTAGMANCPKCFGWQIRDLTKRNAKGWPIEPERIEHCDHCEGRGELAAKPVSGFVNSPLVEPIPAEPVKRTRKSSWQPPAEINDIDDKPNPWSSIKPAASGWDMSKVKPNE